MMIRIFWGQMHLGQVFQTPTPGTTLETTCSLCSQDRDFLPTLGSTPQRQGVEVQVHLTFMTAFRPDFCLLGESL